MRGAIDGDGGDGDDDDIGACNPDQNGTTGGVNVIHLTMTDTGFTVGAVGNGPGEPNITTENLAHVMLTITNSGTRPHDFVIQCIATPNTSGCPQQTCFPPEANSTAIDPGAMKTLDFVTPAHEGAYPFSSDLPGDTALIGQFVLM